MRLELHAVHRLDVAIQRGDSLGGGLDRRAVGVGTRLHGVDPLCEGAVGVGAGGLFALQAGCGATDRGRELVQTLRGGLAIAGRDPLDRKSVV